jgi:4-amino-4-deoxy-L-arabinose transferase-like glycosyltransferase
MLIGFLLRLIAGQYVNGGLDIDYQFDEGDYAKVAIRVLQGTGFTLYNGLPTTSHPPGLPLLLAALISVAGPTRWAMRVLMCFIGTLLIPACYLLTTSLTGSRKIGSFAGALAALFPVWVVSSSQILTDIPAAVLVTLMVWALIEGQRRQSLTWIAGGSALWGAATMIRSVCLIYGPGLALWLVLLMPTWKKRAAALLVLIVPFVCILLPWTIRNTRVHGRFVLLSTQGGK